MSPDSRGEKSGGALTFPGNDASEALWLPRRDAPLRPAVVRDAEQADLAGRPVLLGGPLDAFGKVARGRGRHGVEEAGRRADAALVDPDDDVALADPILCERAL